MGPWRTRELLRARGQALTEIRIVAPGTCMPGVHARRGLGGCCALDHVPTVLLKTQLLIPVNDNAHR
jgi:hypothetical protein